jgi:hypothetical protein
VKALCASRLSNPRLCFWACILCQARYDDTNAMRHDGSHTSLSRCTIRIVPYVGCSCDSAMARHYPFVTVAWYRVCVALHITFRRLNLHIEDEVRDSRMDKRCRGYCDTVSAIALATSSRGVDYATLAHKIKLSKMTI